MRGQMDRDRSGVLGERGRRLLYALALSSPAVLAAACAETPSLEIPAGGGATSTAPPLDGELEERCGKDGVRCGGEDSCCLAGNICSPFGRCIPSAPCTTNEQCNSDSVCGGGKCVPWDTLPQNFRFNATCRTPVDLASLIPELQCEWPGANAPAEFPEHVQVIGTPMVVDFNFDNDPKTSFPSIVFISYAGPFASNTGVIRVIDGKTCTLQDTIPGEFFFSPEVPVALGDVDADGRPDIIAADEEPNGAAVRSGIQAWSVDTGTTFRELSRVASGSTATIQGLALADVDGDKYPEIFTEATMLHYDPDKEALVDLTALQIQGRAPLTAREPPMVVDIDHDNLPEILTSQGIFYWNTETLSITDKAKSGVGVTADPLWKQDGTDNVPGVFLGIANLDEFPTELPGSIDSTEMVVVGSNGSLWVKQVDGRAKLTVNMQDKVGGPPVIADFDGDGRVEFASPGSDWLTVFDMDCMPDSKHKEGCGGGKVTPNANGVMWEMPIQGFRSGAAVFDFDGDGRAEVVYADQCFMRIYDGLTGAVIFSTPRRSTTSWEYPVVADVSGQGNSAIVLASNDNDPTVTCDATDLQNTHATVASKKTHGVSVWREKNDRWAGSRPIWNEHNYHVTNVNDDGTIPTMQDVKTSWDTARGGFNTFRQNVQGATGKSLSLADVTTAGVPKFECLAAPNRAEVTMDLCNRGVLPIAPKQTSLVLVRADSPGNVLCTLENTVALGPGACSGLTCEIDAGPLPFDISVLGDPGGKVNECNENNNTSLISRVSCAQGPK
jgi:hypothetical protein